MAKVMRETQHISPASLRVSICHICEKLNPQSVNRLVYMGFGEDIKDDKFFPDTHRFYREIVHGQEAAAKYKDKHQQAKKSPHCCGLSKTEEVGQGD